MLARPAVHSLELVRRRPPCRSPFTLAAAHTQVPLLTSRAYSPSRDARSLPCLFTPTSTGALPNPCLLLLYLDRVTFDNCRKLADDSQWPTYDPHIPELPENLFSFDLLAEEFFENKTVVFVGDSTNRIVWHAAECEAAKSPDALWRPALEDGARRPSAAQSAPCARWVFTLPVSSESLERIVIADSDGSPCAAFSLGPAQRPSGTATATR